MENIQNDKQKFVTGKKPTNEKIPKFPRYNNDSLRQIIRDLKAENLSIRRKLESYESMYKKLEKEYNDYKLNLYTIREMDILGDAYFDPFDKIEEETN